MNLQRFILWMVKKILFQFELMKFKYDSHYPMHDLIYGVNIENACLAITKHEIYFT